MAPSRSCKGPVFAKFFHLELDGIRPYSFTKGSHITRTGEKAFSNVNFDVESGIPAMSASDWMWGMNSFPIVHTRELDC